MKCPTFSVVSVVACLVATATAGDFVEDIRREFGAMGLFPRQNSNSIQFFNGKTGASASAITSTGDEKRPFQVEGDTFTDFKSAANRVCDNQKNECANNANSNKNSGLSVSDCDKQNEQCKASASSAQQTSFNQGGGGGGGGGGGASSTTSSTGTFQTSNAEFDFICDL